MSGETAKPQTIAVLGGTGQEGGGLAGVEIGTTPKIVHFQMRPDPLAN